ncbi:MAG: hypothetical protein PHP55_03980 [Methanoculleus sp.]|nr:hypothetical protein [Methanoculleus sp.]MDD3932992.1 hypothetical protein [Methanoculleus sp.]
MTRIYSISLILIATIFFFPLLSVVPGLPRSIVFIPPAVAILAFFSSVYCIWEIKKQSSRWYFGIPLVLVIGLFAVSYPFYDINSPFSPLWSPTLLLLAPASATFFFSFGAVRKQMAHGFTLLLSILSVNPVCILFCMMLFSHSFSNELVFFAFIMYYMLEMPFIGFMYLIAAWKMR